MKNILIGVIITIFIISCFQPTTTEQSQTEDSLTVKTMSSVYLRDIGYIIDSTFTDSTDLSLIVDFKYINTNRKVIECDVERSIALYLKIIHSDSCTEFPVFEVKNSNNSVLVVGGKRDWSTIWGMYLIDRSSRKIKKVEFYYLAEVVGLGAGISCTDFEKQFINLPIQIKGNSFGLTQNKEIVIQGENIIDGVSGASLSSKTVVEISNQLGLLTENMYNH